MNAGDAVIVRGPLRGSGEVAEDEATGAVADAYARLRDALGVDFLPTVVRMLGRYDRLLTATTDAMAGVLGGPEGAAFAGAARARGTEAAERLPGGALAAGAAAADVRVLLERYNVANPRNLLLVTALSAGLADAEPAPGTTPAPPPAGVATAAGAPAVMYAPLPAPVPGLLDDIRACHGGFTVPGMWRELAASRPAVAERAWRLVRPLAGEDELHAAIADVAARAAAVVRGQAMPNVADLGYDAEAQADIAGIVTWFRLGIPTMVIEIEYLRHRLRGA
ncbi:hypothetical protein [Capillimicrobium parvum]|uniref:Uncharacterized protein n=1 Tax=Capillimicrobium parvum TaxID=2884022 RepID=A0A9E6Y3S1_9ACTN|nr:hypothetical protein [Capillimicrobium parvum]UGS39145.1 hypothetical protein DSM104329_05577 [Capillimicrobium parvum]